MLKAMVKRGIHKKLEMVHKFRALTGAIVMSNRTAVDEARSKGPKRNMD